MLRHLCLIAFVSSASVCAYAQGPIGSAIISGTSRERLKNELVLRLTRENEFRLVGETSFQISFERNSNTKPSVYQVESPVDRFVFTVADADHGIQVATNVLLVENGGTSMERHTVVRDGKVLQEAHDVIASIGTEFAKTNDATTARQQETSVRSSVKFKTVPHLKQVFATRREKLADVSGRLGFSAAVSKGDEAHGGVQITAVDPETPAAKAGLQPADIVVGIDGQPVATGEQMEAGRARLLNRKHGSVKVMRNGKMFVATLNL